MLFVEHVSVVQLISRDTNVWRNALKHLISGHGVWVSLGAGVSVQISLCGHKTERLCSCGVVSLLNGAETWTLKAAHLLRSNEYFSF